MKRTKNKIKRLVKYWRVTYQQASWNDRVFVGTFVLMMLVSVWWAMLAI